MEFPRLMKRKQWEHGMTGVEFAKFLGKSRPWLMQLYCSREDTKKYKLSELTMYDIEDKLGIPLTVMEQYNRDVEAHNERIEKSKRG